MPYRCTSCSSYFSVRKGTVMQSSKLGYRIWATAIYLVNTSLKSVPAMKLHRDLGTTQASAWRLLQRVREGFDIAIEKLEGVVEVDEMFVGGKQRNRHRAQRAKHSGYDPWGKKPVVRAVPRGRRVTAMPVRSVDGPTLVAFVEGNVRFGSRVYTDDHGGYEDLMESYMHRGGATLDRPVRPGLRYPHEHDREPVVHVQARLHRRVPPDELQAPAPVRDGGLLALQRPGSGHTRPDRGDGARDGREAAPSH